MVIVICSTSPFIYLYKTYKEYNKDVIIIVFMNYVFNPQTQSRLRISITTNHDQWHLEASKMFWQHFFFSYVMSTTVSGTMKAALASYLDIQLYLTIFLLFSLRAAFCQNSQSNQPSLDTELRVNPQMTATCICSSISTFWKSHVQLNVAKLLSIRPGSPM